MRGGGYVQGVELVSAAVAVGLGIIIIFGLSLSSQYIESLHTFDVNYFCFPYLQVLLLTAVLAISCGAPGRSSPLPFVGFRGRLRHTSDHGTLKTPRTVVNHQ